MCFGVAGYSAVKPSSGKEKESCCLEFSSSTKFRNFYVVVVQQRQRNVEKKRDARAKLFLLI